MRAQVRAFAARWCGIDKPGYEPVREPVTPGLEGQDVVRSTLHKSAL